MFYIFQGRGAEDESRSAEAMQAGVSFDPWWILAECLGL